MENALRPYLTAGVAVLGAGMIAVAPVAPPVVPEVPMPQIAMTGAVADLAGAILQFTVNDVLTLPLPVDLYGGVPLLFWTEALENLASMANNPLPVLGTIIDDPTTALSNISDAIAAVGTTLSFYGTALSQAPGAVVVDTGGYLDGFVDNLSTNPVLALQNLLAAPEPALHLLTAVPLALVSEIPKSLPAAIGDALAGGGPGSATDILDAMGGLLQPVGLDFVVQMLQDVIAMVF